MGNNFNKEFSNVFEGIHCTMDAIDSELDLLKKINAEQKIELKKAKRFNIIMLIIALLSLAFTIIGFILGLSI